MLHIDINNPFCDFITITYICKNCNKYSVNEINNIKPFSTFESFNDSYNNDVIKIECTNCDYMYDVILTVGITGGYLEINDLTEESLINIDESSIFLNTDFYSTFESQIEDIDTLLKEIKSKDKLLLKLLYINLITILETYLSDAFINTILSYDKYLEKFYQKFNFKNKSIETKRLYNFDRKKYAQFEMLEIIYHNIHIVSNLYSNILGINFKDSSKIKKAIQKRHDLVHRNGKDRNGNDIIIEKDDIEEIKNEIKKLVYHIDEQLKNITINY